MGDWLDTTADPSPVQIVSSALADSVSSPGKLLEVDVALPAKYRERVLALNAISWRQRQWIKAYLDEGCGRNRAAAVLRKIGAKPPDMSTVTRWTQQEGYRRALQLMKAHYVEMAGMDRESILLKAGVVLENAMTPKPVLHMGEHTGFEEIDGNVAMRAIEFAGKVNKMTAPDNEGPRVTLVVNIANRDDLESVDVVAEQ